MSVEELVKRLRDYGLTIEPNIVICDRRVIDETADKLEELAAENREHVRRNAELNREISGVRRSYTDEKVKRIAAEGHAQKLREAHERIAALDEASGYGLRESHACEAVAISTEVLALTPEAAERQAGTRVKVKPLKWEEFAWADGVEKRESPFGWKALGLGLDYRIQMHFDEWYGVAVYRLSRERNDLGNFSNGGEAQAAAQADYERRILSAITIEPAPAIRATKEDEHEV